MAQTPTSMAWIASHRLKVVRLNTSLGMLWDQCDRWQTKVTQLLMSAPMIRTVQLQQLVVLRNQPMDTRANTLQMILCTCVPAFTLPKWDASSPKILGWVTTTHLCLSIAGCMSRETQ